MQCGSAEIHLSSWQMERGSAASSLECHPTAAGSHDDERSGRSYSQFNLEVRMQRSDRSTLSSLQRVQEFLAQHPMSDVPASLGAQASALNEVITRLSTEAVDQEAGRRLSSVHSESQRQLRKQLVTDHVRPISRVAREVFGVTGMDRAFRMATVGKSNQALIAAAGAMAEAAEKQKDVFVQHGLSQDFIEQLQAAATALGDARNAKVESARRRVTATAAVTDQLKRGRKAVRLLDAILQPRLAKDPELLAAWRSAKRVPPGTTAIPAVPAATPSPVTKAA